MNIEMDWNARAVAYLQDGQVEASLLILKNELASARDKMTQEDLMDESSRMPRGKEMHPEDSLIASVSILEDGEDAWESDGNLFSFYPRAFVTQGDLLDETAKLMVLFYNLAMAHQIEAANLRKRGQTTDYQRSLYLALHMYKSALELSHTFSDDRELANLSGLVLASLNNIGYISSHQMDFHRSCHCIQMMCELLSHERALVNEVVPDEDVELFLVSVFTYIDVSPLVIAPAA